MKLLPAESLDKLDTIKKQFPEILFNSSGFRKAACEKAGISRTAFYNWLKEDPEFRQAIEEVDKQLIDMAESQLLINIKKGKETSLIFYLKNKAPKKWRDVHEIEVTPPEEMLRQMIERLKNEPISEDSPGAIQQPDRPAIPSDTGTE